MEMHLCISSKFYFLEIQKCIYVLCMSLVFGMIFIVFNLGLIYYTLYCLCSLIICNMVDNQDRLRTDKVS